MGREEVAVFFAVGDMIGEPFGMRWRADLNVGVTQFSGEVDEIEKGSMRDTDFLVIGEQGMDVW